jgi:peptidoglycan/xylan/chitin deacetylase (PgdA/CDA1 family)/SAM-dependent methyltransferase
VGEDWDLWQRLARQGLRLAALPGVHATYVLRAGSASRRDFARVYRDIATVIRRGHTTDDRVAAPVPAWAAGAPTTGLPGALREYLWWTLALAIAGDADGVRSLLAGAERVPRHELAPFAVASTLFYTGPLGVGHVVDEWELVWPVVGDRLAGAVTALVEWLGAPSSGRAILRPLEQLVATTRRTTRTVPIGRTLAMTLDLADPVADVAVGKDVEQLVVHVVNGRDPIGVAVVAALDEIVTGDAIVGAVRHQLGGRLARTTIRRPWRSRGAAAPSVDPTVARGALRLLLDLPAARPQRARVVRAFGRAAARGPRPDPPAEPHTARPVEAPFSAGETYWESLFTSPDPWGYTNNYEQVKYDQTLSLIEGRAIGRALELACAEGHFTVQLAPHVDHLLATDISTTALTRAAERCAAYSNIDYEQMDLRTAVLPSDLDLVVCSEVLYYLARDDVVDLARRIRDSLRPGGIFVHAHARVLTDEPDQTGFDWGHPYGATGIGEIMSATDGLQLRRELRSDLYRIQLFERVPDGAPEELPETVPVPYADPLESEISRMVVWGGLRADRDAVWRDEITDCLPILMYHSVAESGPAAVEPYRVSPDAFEAQLEYLRRHAYYGMTIGEWAYYLDRHRVPPGRAVVLTFDDGYHDFYEHAWPLLQAYKFPATVFVVAGKVGATSDWDDDLGAPLPLLDWPTIRKLQDDGIEFGSHTGDHRSLTTLAPREALVRERAARHRLAAELGRPVTTIAYPSGAIDEVARQAMRAAGHRIGLETAEGYATVWDDPMALPRIEVGHGDDLDSFVAKLGQSTRRNPLRQGLRQVRSVADRVRRR